MTPLRHATYGHVLLNCFDLDKTFRFDMSSEKTYVSNDQHVVNLSSLHTFLPHMILVTFNVSFCIKKIFLD